MFYKFIPADSSNSCKFLPFSLKVLNNSSLEGNKNFQSYLHLKPVHQNKSFNYNYNFFFTFELYEKHVHKFKVT